MALTLCIPSLISAGVAVNSAFLGLGENLTLFIHVIAFYLFLRLLVHFTLNLLGERVEHKRFPIILKIILEIVRFILILFIVINQDMSFMYPEMPTLILSSVVATIAIDTIATTLEKYPKKLNSDEIDTPTNEVITIGNDAPIEKDTENR